MAESEREEGSEREEESEKEDGSEREEGNWNEVEEEEPLACSQAV